MTKKKKDWLGAWGVLFCVPTFAVWTIGIPFHGLTFWFDERGIAVAIAWFWLSLLLVINVAFKGE